MFNYYHCYYHQDCSPVVQCTRCGNFLCQECASKIVPNEKGEILCPDCQKALAAVGNEEKKTDSRVNELEEQKSKLILNALFCFIGMGTGAALYFFGGEKGYEILGIIIWGLGGVTTAWSLIKRASAQWLIPFNLNGLIASVCIFVFRLIAVVLVALVAAPILFIVNIVKIVDISSDIKEG